MNKEVLKKAIGIKIKQMRTIKGWSREHMADKLKMSVSNYGNIERGETDIDVVRLTKIAEIFAITLQDLLGLTEKTIFNFTTSTTVNAISSGTNPTSNNISDTNLIHELEKTALLLKERDKEIENLKQQIAQLQEINGLLKAAMAAMPLS
jgi:transcriptional regulator with XRE-family HTH domain